MKQKIKEEMIAAMKSRDKEKVAVLRYLLSQIGYVEIDKHEDLTDAEIVNLIQKEVKKRKEAKEMFIKGGRQDLINQQDFEIKTLEVYLPKQMNDEELSSLIKELWEADKTQNMGAVIKNVLVKVNGQADGGRIASLAKQICV